MTKANNIILTEKENNNSANQKLQMIVKELENTKVRLEKEIIEKDDHIRKLAIELAANDISETDTQNPALLATIESLETIINQKEETINRLQELLKENREDHTKEMIELQKKTEAQHFDNKEKYVLFYSTYTIDRITDNKIGYVLLFKYNIHALTYVSMFVTFLIYYIIIIIIIPCFILHTMLYFIYAMLFHYI